MFPTKNTENGKEYAKYEGHDHYIKSHFIHSFRE